MKQNDYIIASLNNPEFNPGDFRTLGMDLDNTQMLSKDEYLKSDYIKQNDAFKDENGEFSKSKFDTFYDNSLRNFQTFSDIETDFQYDMFDYRRYDTEGANVKDPKLKFFQITNPQELTIGDGWVNEINESPLSDRERASKSKIYDYEKGEFLDYSPNEHSLVNNPIEWFKDLFDEPLVLAQYEEDGTHIDPFSGREVKHTKGEYKIGSDGKYFYETLGGRDLGSKQVLSKFDTLTVDGEGLNKYDFFDSDDREKSVGGVIMKTAAAIAPMFLPGPWAAAYSVALVGRELVKVLPMLDGLAGMVTGNDTPTAFTRLANDWAGRATSWTSSQDDYSRDHMFSFGNFANLMSDVALQWGQQKVIAQAISKLKGASSLTKGAEESAFKLWQTESNNLRAKLTAQDLADTELAKIIGDAKSWKTSALGAGLLTNAMKEVYPAIEKAQDLGKSASLMYMALVSNTDVYQSMLEHGLTKREAMAVTLGSTFGMFAVDKYLHLGETFFDDWGLDNGKIAIRNSIAKEVDKWSGQLRNIAKESTKKGKNSVWTTIFKTQELLKPKYETFFSALKNHSLNALGKSLGEGLEEVSEELCSDLSKQIYEWSAQWDVSDKFFGDLTTDNVEAFDNFGEDPQALNKIFARYMMNFAGGFMGGGLFWGVEKWQNRHIPTRNNEQDNLVYAIRNYGAKRLLNDLKEKRDNKKLGNANLSIDHETVDGQKTWLTANEDHMSQNDFVYNQIKNTIISIDKIINDNELMKTDEELKEQMTMGELRFSRLLEILDENADYSKGYIERYNTLVTDFAVLESKIQQLKAQKPDPAKDSEAYEQDIAKLEKKKADVFKQIQDFKSGENALDYMDMMLFGMDEKLNHGFYPANFGAWLRAISDDEENPYDIRSFDDYDKLDASERRTLLDKYMKYKNSGAQMNDMEKGWKAYKDLRNVIGDDLVNMQVETKDKSSYLQMIHNILYSEDSPLYKAKQFTADEIADDDPYYDWDAKTYMDMQDDLLYQARDTKMTSESDEDFATRQEERKKELKKMAARKKTYNNYLEALEKVKDMIVNAGNFLAPQDRRHLLNMLDVRQKDIVTEQLNTAKISSLSKKNSKYIQTILKDLKDDLSNVDDIQQRINDVVLQELEEDLQTEIKNIIDIRTSFASQYNKGVLEPLLEQLEKNGSITQKEREDFNNYKFLYAYLQEHGAHTLIGKATDAAGNVLTEADLRNPALTFADIFVDDHGTRVSLEYLLSQYKSIYRYTELNYSLNLHLLLNSNNVYFKTEADKVDLSVIEYEAFVREEFLNKCKAYDILTDDGTEIDPDKLNKLIQKTAIGKRRKNIDKFLEKENLSDDKIKNNSPQKEKILKYLFTYQGIVDALKEDPVNYKKASKKLEQIQLSGFVESNGKIDELQQRNLKHALGDDFEDVFKYIRFVQDPATKLWKVDLDATVDALEEYKTIKIAKYVKNDNGTVKNLEYELEYFFEDIGNSSEVASLKQNASNGVDTSFSTFKSGVEMDEVYDYIKTLKEAKPIKNPVIEIVKKLGLGLNRDTKNVEELLERMSTILHGTSRDDFALSDPERAALDEADDLLELAQSFLWSCYNSKTFQYPYPHNQLHNQIVDKYKLNLEKLPEIDDDVASLYWRTIEGLRKEIGQRTKNNEVGWTPGSYRYWDARNAVNKSQKLIKANSLSTKTKLALLSQNVFKGSVSINGTDITYNLLEGVDSITDTDEDIKLYKTEKLFYENIQTLFKNHPELTLQQIFEGTTMSDFLDDIDLLREQLTANSDEHLSSERLTPMDKGRYFITLAGLDPDQFFAAQKEFVANHKNIAPLDVQSDPVRTSMAYLCNPEIFKSGLDWLYKASGCTEKDHLKLYSVFIPGNGGAGKTEVVISAIAEYAKNANIVLAGPSEGQLPNLSKINVGTVEQADKLLIDILGETNYAKCTSDAEQKDEWGKDTCSMGKLKPHKNMVEAPVYNGNFPMKDLKIGMILIDEATHLPLWKIEILNQYAATHNIPLIFVGDNYQQGFQIESQPTNINSEYVFTIRTSRLAITLRDANVQKYNNIKKETHLIHALMEEPLPNPFDPNGSQKRKINLDQAIKEFKDFSIAYYNGSELNGDIVVDNLTEELLGKVDIPNKIAYIGSNSSTFEMLKRKYGDKVVQIASEVAVQGQEFDSVVVEVAWDKIDVSGPTETVANKAGMFLNRFYTLSTRGKVSSIFIDPSGNLKSLVHPVEEQYQNTVTNFGDTAKQAFRESFEEKLKKLNIPAGINPTYVPKQKSSTNPGSTQAGGTTTPTGVSPSPTPTPTGSGVKASFAPAEIHPTTEAPEPVYEENENGEEFIFDKSNLPEDDIKISDIIEEEFPVKKDANGDPLPTPDNQARAYGAAMIAGVERVDVTDAKGNVVSHRYIYNDNDNVVSDLGVFMAGKTTALETTNDIQTYEKYLQDFKSLILFNHDYRDYETLFARLANGTPINDVISKEDYEGIISGNPKNIKIVVSKRNPKTDHFIGRSGLDSSKMEIGDNKLVYKIVAEFTLKGTNKKARITLGLMADPETYSKKRDGIMSRLAKFVQDKRKYKQTHPADTTWDDDIKWAEQYLRILNNEKGSDKDPVKKYKDYIDQLAKDFKNLGNPSRELVVDLPSKLHYSRTSVIRTVHAGTGKTAKVRLSGYSGYNSPTFDSMYVNTGQLQVSDTYIYIPSSSASDRRSYSGKGVVFITSDTMLRGDLKREWEEEQRKGTSQHSVRAVRLDNIGVSLSQLCNSDMSDLFDTKASEEDLTDTFPFENREMGIRMLISLWNWRANLNNFSNRWNEFRNANDVLSKTTDIDIDGILLKMHETYKALDEQLHADGTLKHSNQHPTNEQYVEALSKQLSEQNWKIAEQILKFNENCNGLVREFRLGTGNDNRGYIVRDLQLPEGNALYQKIGKKERKNEKIYGIYINLSTLHHMTEMTNELCNQLFGVGDNAYYQITDSKGNIISQDENIAQDKFEGYIEAIRKNSEGAPFKIVGGEFTENMLKTIPLAITKITKRSIAYGKTVENEKGVLGLKEFKTKKNGKENVVPFREWQWKLVSTFKVTHQELNQDGTKKGEKQIVAEMNVAKLVKYGKPQSTGEISLAKMLDLCFHGTTEEFIEARLLQRTQKEKSSNSSYNRTNNPYFVAQAQDAFFKYGFFSDPVAKMSKSDKKNRKGELWANSATSNAMYVVNARVDLPYVFFDFTGTEKFDKGKDKPEYNILGSQADIEERINFFSKEAYDMQQELNIDPNLENQAWLKEILKKELGISEDLFDTLKIKVSVDTDTGENTITVSQFDDINNTINELTITQNTAKKKVVKLNEDVKNIVKVIDTTIFNHPDKDVKDGFWNVIKQAAAEAGLSEKIKNQRSLYSLTEDEFKELILKIDGVDAFDEEIWEDTEITYDKDGEQQTKSINDFYYELNDLITNTGKCKLFK